MPMYNSSATLYQYKRNEPPEVNAIDDLTADNSSSFKYKINLLGNVTEVADDAAGVRRLNVKATVPLKYLSNFFRSLEMPLINCKIKLNLTWGKKCVLSTGAGEAVFMINNTKIIKIIKILSNNKIKDFKDLYIGTIIKQKNKTKMLMLITINILF